MAEKNPTHLPKTLRAESLEHINEYPQDVESPFSQLDRIRRHSVSLEKRPILTLVAVTPNSKKAVSALPRLLSYMSSQPNVLVAIDEALSNLCPHSVATVRAASSPKQEKVSSQYNASEVDLVICIGGDGLIFHVLHKFFPTKVPPFIPFNMGSMGFLTPFDFRTFEKDISKILCGSNKKVTTRMRLKCIVLRCEIRSACVHNFHHNELTDGPARGVEEFHVLNEVVIDRGPAPYLSNLEVLADECPVTRVQGDGLIVATPTGSTAYSLSSGGSMVHPCVPAILFTPICPHSLSFRPVLFPENVTLQIKVPKDSRATAWVSFDGRHRMELMKGDRVVISVSPWAVPTFNKRDVTNDWFASVSQCLRWNDRVIQGSSDPEIEQDAF